MSWLDVWSITEVPARSPLWLGWPHPRSRAPPLVGLLALDLVVNTLWSSSGTLVLIWAAQPCPHTGFSPEKLGLLCAASFPLWPYLADSRHWWPWTLPLQLSQTTVACLESSSLCCGHQSTVLKQAPRPSQADFLVSCPSLQDHCFVLHIVPHLPALWLRQAGESGSGSSVIGGSGSLLENIHIVNLKMRKEQGWRPTAEDR